MGFFTKSKKSAPSLTTTPNKPGILEGLTLKRQHRSFLKHAAKDADGYPVASRIYWNTVPPIPCTELQKNAVFILDNGNVDLYEKQHRGDLERPLYTFNAICGSKGDKDALRIVGPSPDYALVRSWLDQCNEAHTECQIHGSTGDLKIITLIDVRNRCLVRYKPGSQYAALSYVWGGAPAPKRNPACPDELPTNMSRTINHAMVVAEKLEIPFLWADAVCIDQENDEEKNQQLPLMDSIYKHAVATIVATGDHANVGLPGVPGGPERIMQLMAEFGPLKLMARSPLLSSQIESSVWSKRGWTYQESLLSRRCIFFSQHQVYFHCNSMFCSEDSPTPKYISGAEGSSSDAAYISRYSLPQANIHARDYAVGDMDLFASYFNEYSSRKVTHEEDAIKAFSALLSHLQRSSFPNGFLHGIPRDAFRDGLLWRAYGNIHRREKCLFPSWSWAAWESKNGGTEYLGQFYKTSKVVPPPLHISLGKHYLHTGSASNIKYIGLGFELQRLWDVYRAREPGPCLARTRPSLPMGDTLYIDGPVATLSVTYDSATQSIGFDVPTCLAQVVRLSSGFPRAPKQPMSEHKFLVVDTKHMEGPLDFIQFRLLLLHMENKNVVSRGGVFDIEIASGLDAFWEYAQVRRTELWFV